MTRIQTNRNQRQILVIDNSRDIKGAFSYAESDFDAVLLLMETASEVIRVMLDINPIFTDLTCYKPFFASSASKGQIGRYDEMIDGYADDADDAAMAEKIEEILTRSKKMGMRRFLSNVDSPLLVFVRVCRFLMTRGINRITPVLLEGSSLGYTSPAFDLAMRIKRMGARDAITYKNMLVGTGLARNVKFINRVHLCPDCFHSHLIYVESCPHCGSSQIHAEEVIHHFRCANISPEHTYNHNGQLRCPKCHEMLRHIGVDYDRPATTYSCQVCDETFVQPTMKSICSYCGKEHKVEELISYDCYEYEFTDEGKKAFVSPETHLRLQSGYYDNLMPFPSFCSQLELISSHSRQNNLPLNFVIRKVWITDANGDTLPIAMDVVAMICEQLPFARVGYQDSLLCVREISSTIVTDKSLSEELATRFKEVMKMVSVKINKGEKLCSSRTVLSDNSMQALEDFLHNLTFIDANPDIVFSMNEKPHTSYNIAVPNRDEETEDNGLSQENETASNQPSSETVSPRKKKLAHPYSKLWLILVALLVAVVLFIFALWITRVKHAPEPIMDYPSAEVQATDKDVATNDVMANVPDLEKTTMTKDGKGVQPQAVDDMRPAMPYVVVTAAFTSRDKASDYAISTSSQIYKKGSRYVVSPFAADDIAVCNEYIKKHPIAGASPWVWKVKAKDLKK